MPLTSKGTEIMSSMQQTYGAEKGERVFYASKNAGTISGVDSAKLDAACAKMDAAGKSKAEKIASLKKEIASIEKSLEGPGHSPSGRRAAAQDLYDARNELRALESSRADAELPYQTGLKADWKVEKRGRAWYAIGTGLGGERFEIKKGAEWEADKYARMMNENAREAEEGNRRFVAERKAEADRIRAGRTEQRSKQGGFRFDEEGAVRIVRIAAGGLAVVTSDEKEFRAKTMMQAVEIAKREAARLGTTFRKDSLDAACVMMDAAQPSEAWRAAMQNKDNLKSYEVAGANAKETYQLRKKIEEAERAGNATRMAELRAVYAHVEAVGKAAHESRPVNSTRAFGSRLDEACSKMDALTK